MQPAGMFCGARGIQYVVLERTPCPGLARRSSTDLRGYRDMLMRDDAGHRYAVVLAGGSGTRLWPLSRGDEPKQLIPLQGGKSLLEIALDRLDVVVDPPARYVCAGERHRSAVARRVASLPPRQYLGEPEARDTLAAVAFASAVIRRTDGDAVIGIFTADHLIRPAESFREMVARGFDLAAADARTVVTFGIAPTHPATGYGYLELGEDFDGGALRVSRFREKPDPLTAAAFVEAGPERYMEQRHVHLSRLDVPRAARELRPFPRSRHEWCGRCVGHTS